MIDHYTKSYSKIQRSEGQSWPVNILAEFHWNFSFFGPIFYGLFLIIVGTRAGNESDGEVLVDRSRLTNGMAKY